MQTYEASFWGDKNVLSLTAGMVVPISGYSKNFEWCLRSGCSILYLNKATFKQRPNVKIKTFQIKGNAENLFPADLKEGNLLRPKGNGRR